MTFTTKLESAIKEIDKTGIWKSNYYPPIIKLLHKLGIKIPLPHYNSFLNNFLMMGTGFGVIWGLFMYFFVWNKMVGMPIIYQVLIGVVAGVFFGLSLAGYYRYGAEKHGLSSWDSL